jgi:hypothetical protein
LARPEERAGLDRHFSPLGWPEHGPLSAGPLNRPVRICHSPQLQPASYPTRTLKGPAQVVICRPQPQSADELVHSSLHSRRPQMIALQTQSRELTSEQEPALPLPGGSEPPTQPKAAGKAMLPPAPAVAASSAWPESAGGCGFDDSSQIPNPELAVTTAAASTTAAEKGRARAREDPSRSTADRRQAKPAAMDVGG